MNGDEIDLTEGDDLALARAAVAWLLDKGYMAFLNVYPSGGYVAARLDIGLWPEDLS